MQQQQHKQHKHQQWVRMRQERQQGVGLSQGSLEL
jgi:hypothetical protein